MLRSLFSAIFIFMALFFLMETGASAADCATGRTYGNVSTRSFESCDLETTCFLVWSYTGCAKVKCVEGETSGAILNQCYVGGQDGGAGTGRGKDIVINPGEEKSFDFRCKDLFTVYDGKVKFTSIKYEGGGCPDALGLRGN